MVSEAMVSKTRNVAWTIHLLMASALNCAWLPRVALADIYEQQPKSWVWYKDSPPPEAVQPKKKPQKSTASAADGLTAKAALKAMGEDLEEAEAQSILNPTTTNIKHAIELKRQALALSQTYADRYEQVVWKNPELDYTIERPMRTDALFTANPLRQEKLTAALATAAQSNALVYVFRSDCPYCKKFSPVLKRFAESNGFTVLAFSLDGVGNDEFPYPKADMDQLKAKGLVPKVVPALYIVNPKKGTSEAVGFGLMNMTDLQTRVALAAGIDIYEGSAAVPRSPEE